MKATMEFNLPDERIEHRDAMQGTDCRLVLWDLAQEMRNCVKYDRRPCFVPDEDIEATKDINKDIRYATHHWMARLYAIADDYGIRLDEE